MKIFQRNIGSLLTLLFLLCGISPLRAAVTGAWAAGDGEKVYRYQADHPCRGKSSIWDGRSIRLKGLYNEILAFQVIVEADSFGAASVEVTIDPPEHETSGRRIAGSVPMNYGPGGTIEIYSQHYMKVEDLTEIKSKTNWLASSPLFPNDRRPLQN